MSLQIAKLDLFPVLFLYVYSSVLFIYWFLFHKIKPFAITHIKLIKT